MLLTSMLIIACIANTIAAVLGIYTIYTIYQIRSKI